MNEKEIELYLALMRAMRDKAHGNVEEVDVQRALGALYQTWKDIYDR